MLKVSVPILLEDPDLDEVIVVNQGSKDGTKEWLATQPVIAVNKENDGAGPGRNRGIEAALPFDFALFLDGGIRPLLPGIKIMLDFLQRRDDVDVLGLLWSDLETDIEMSWRRWPYSKIEDNMTYEYRMLSLTAYCLTNARAWDGLRFNESGPWGEPGWGGDDDEMAYQWREAGINVHALEGVKAYRRGSGSFRRLFQETGIWPNQYGSTYEKRVVDLMHRWPQMGPGIQWGEPWLTIIVQNTGNIEQNAAIIKAAHNGMRQWHLDGKWKHIPQPYSVVLWFPEEDWEVNEWAGPRHLRQHHGDTTIVNGEIVRRNETTEPAWAGDFRIWHGDNPADAVRDNAHYWAVIETIDDLWNLLDYWQRFPKEVANKPPDVRRERVNYGNID